MFVTTVVCSFLLGVISTILVLYVFVRKKLFELPRVSIPNKPQFPKYKIPQGLAKLLKDPNQLGRKENCLYLNLIIQFLFRELKDTKRIRQNSDFVKEIDHIVIMYQYRLIDVGQHPVIFASIGWMVKKMNVEFEEMLQTTTGKLIDQISVRDFSLGEMFPIINNVTVKKASVENEEYLEELDVALDIDYNGGFQLAVDIDLVFGKWAYLCVTITNLKGLARFQLTRHPYTHWSFSFYEEPQLDFDVESRFGGKSLPLPQITSLVTNQIRRSVRKKHVLPNYKMRCGPLFEKPEDLKPVGEINLFGNRIGDGKLQVTVIECSRLSLVPADSKLYCTLSVDSMQWLEFIGLKKKLWVVHDIEIISATGTSVGIGLKEDFLLEKYEDVIVVDKVEAGSPAAQASVKKGDILVSVGTTRITSLKQAKKLFKNAGERILMRIERPKSKGQPNNHDVELLEDMVTALVYYESLTPAEGNLNGGDDVEKEEKYQENREDFVNISIKPIELETRAGQGQTGVRDMSDKLPQKQGVMSLVNSGKALLQRRVRGQTINEGDKVDKQVSMVTDITFNGKTFLKQTQSAGSSPRKEVDFRNVRKRAHSDTSLIKLGDDEMEDEDSDEDPSDIEERVETHRTDEICSKQNPKWNEKFMFNVSSEDKYLNVCVWCKIPEKLDKHDRVIKPGKEILMGHVSLSLPDICLECLMTTQGDTQHTIPLVHAEARAGASRSQFSNYASHKGFMPSLCYGDITLAFYHSPLKMSEEDKKKMTKIKRGKQETVESEQVVTPQISKESEFEEVKSIEEGRHNFTGTNFNTATYCDFCGKKIWLKEAFQCSTCSMICHKKCVERCQARSLCTINGARYRDKPSEPWKPPITQAEAEKRKAKEAARKAGGTGILSKFLKDSSLERKQTPPSSSPRHTSPSPDRLQVPSQSPQHSPQLSRRRNSAPDKDVSPSDSTQGEWLTNTSLPHTRSTTSLQGLVNTNAPPKFSSAELFSKSKSDFGDGDSSDDSDSELVSEIQEHVAKIHRSTGHNLDEMVVTAAKEMGKELFAELSLDERKEKLDNMVMKLQKEIDKESENKTYLIKTLEKDIADPTVKDSIQKSIAKSDEKVEALMMMMLHYCAGLQYCLDQEGEEKRTKDVASTNSEPAKTQTSTDLHMTDSLSSESEKEASGSDHQGTELLLSKSDQVDSTSIDFSVSDCQGYDMCGSSKIKDMSELSPCTSPQTMCLEDSIEIIDDKPTKSDEIEIHEVKQGTSELCQAISNDVIVVESDNVTVIKKDLSNNVPVSAENVGASELLEPQDCVATNKGLVQITVSQENS